MEVVPSLHASRHNLKRYLSRMDLDLWLGEYGNVISYSPLEWRS